MSNYSDYPKQMLHPQHRPAVSVKWDHKIKDPKEQAQGSPERFPSVVVRNLDQEQEYAAKGYIPAGKSDPDAYRKAMTGNETRPDSSFMLYPKWLYRVVDGGELGTKLVNSKAEEDALGKGWYPTPDKAREAPAEIKAEEKPSQETVQADIQAPQVKQKKAGKKAGKKAQRPAARLSRSEARR